MRADLQGSAGRVHVAKRPSAKLSGAPVSRSIFGECLKGHVVCASSGDRSRAKASMSFAPRCRG